MRRVVLTSGACLLALVAGLQVAGLLGGPRAGTPTESAAEERSRASQSDPVLLGTPARRRGAESATDPAPGRAASATDPGPRTRVQGQVLDEQGRPLVGASVRAGTAEALTDADGRFALDLPAPGALALSVSAVGRAEITLSVTSLAAPMHITLGIAPTLAGVVLDETSLAPLAGMLLTARPAASPGAPRGPTTFSRDDGGFTLALTASGPHALEVGGAGSAGRSGAEEYLPRVLTDVEAGRGDLRVLLKRGLTIEGRVLSDVGELLRRPLVVEALGRLPSGDPDFTRRRRVQLPDGRLRVPGLAPGRYDLSLRPVTQTEDLGRIDAAATVVRDIEAGSTGIEVRLARGAMLEGRLEDDAGESVLTKVWVRALPEGESRLELAVMVDAPGDGTFRMGPLEAGVRYDLEAGGFGVLGTGRTRGVTPGDTHVRIVLSRGARIAGRVLDAAGKPVPRGVSVGAFATEGSAELPGRRVFATTDDGGRFVLGGLADLAFEVQAGGGLTGYLGEHVSDVKPGTEELVLRVSPGVRLTGTLVDAEGRPVATTSLGANDGAHRAAMHPYAHVGPDGRFTLSGLRPGPVTLYLMRSGTLVSLGQVQAPGADLQVLVPAE